MCDKNRNAAPDEARSDRVEQIMPECCGPLFERMKETFFDTAQDSPSGSAAETGESKTATPCASAMRRMAEACCGSLSGEETAK